MHFSSLLLSCLVSTSTALTIRSSSFVGIGQPSDLEIAFMTADKAIRNSVPPKALKGSAATSYCHMRNDIDMDAGELAPPSDGLSLYHIALGRGTQNYTCPTSDPMAVPEAVGAVAVLFNVTCLKGSENTTVYSALFNKISGMPREPAEGSPYESGHHYFTNGNVTATFNLHTPYLTGNLGISYSTKTGNVSAPATKPQLGVDGSLPVPWLKLTTIGDTPKPATNPSKVKIASKDMVGQVKEIYRVNTVGGSAPKTCAGLEGTSFQKQYAAEYWFWH